jgi:hypothetical protein
MQSKSTSHWRTVLVSQGRTLRWLALATGKSPRTVYAYSRGELVPPPAWLERVGVVLGEGVES